MLLSQSDIPIGQIGFLRPRVQTGIFLTRPINMAFSLPLRIGILRTSVFSLDEE